MFVDKVELSETVVELFVKLVLFVVVAELTVELGLIVELNTCSAPTARLQSSGSFLWCSVGTLVPLPMIMEAMA